MTDYYMNHAYVQLVQRMVAKLNEVNSEYLYDTEIEEEAVVTVLRNLLIAVGTLEYDEENEVYFVKIDLPVDGYVVYADKIQVL